MRTIIIEDELHNSRLLDGMIKQLRPEWKLEAMLESVVKSVEWLQGNPPPDLIFMDIQLTDGICFSIFEKVQVESMVIFTTAYDEYAIQAFQVNSVDYLLKPIKENKLADAIGKFETLHKQISRPETPDYSEILQAIKQREKKYRQRFLISGSTSYFKVNANDIAYFYTAERVVYAVDFEGKEHIINLTMEHLEEELNPEMFFRANRSTIVNSEAIQKFENYFGGKVIVRLVKPFEEPITISRLKVPAFKEWMDS